MRFLALCFVLVLAACGTPVNKTQKVFFAGASFLPPQDEGWRQREKGNALEFLDLGVQQNRIIKVHQVPFAHVDEASRARASKAGLHEVLKREAQANNKKVGYGTLYFTPSSYIADPLPGQHCVAEAASSTLPAYSLGGGATVHYFYMGCTTPSDVEHMLMVSGRCTLMHGNFLFNKPCHLIQDMQRFLAHMRM